MRKALLFTLCFIFLLLNMCDNNKITKPEVEGGSFTNQLKKMNHDPVNYGRKLESFARALAVSLKEKEVCVTLKEGIGRKFDGDYDVLWKDVKGDKIGKSDLDSIVANRMNLDREVCASEGKKGEDELDDLNNNPLFNISMPENFDKWDGCSPVLVAYMPLDKDDMEVETLKAFDSELNEYELDAKKAPDFPVLIVGMNERIDPITGNVKAFEKSCRSLSKATSSDPKIYLEWIRFSDVHEPWFLGVAEIRMLFLDSSGRKKENRWTNQDEDKWYHKNDYMVFYNSSLGEYVAVAFYEEDASVSGMKVKLKLKYKMVDVEGEFNLSSSDDYMGRNELVDIYQGPIEKNRNKKPSICYTARDVRFTFWWLHPEDPVVKNPGFESAGIWILESDPSCSVSRTTYRKHEGTYSIKISDNSSTGRAATR